MQSIPFNHNFLLLRVTIRIYILILSIDVVDQLPTKRTNVWLVHSLVTCKLRFDTPLCEVPALNTLPVLSTLPALNKLPAYIKLSAL